MKVGRRACPPLVPWLLAALLFCLPAGVAAAADSGCRPPLADRQRAGFVAVSPNWAQAYDIAFLRGGWAVDHAHANPPPAGMDQALVIRTPAGYRINAAVLGPLVDRNPGAIWLIGNEPDCIWQDNIPPEEYARIYHNLHAFIKGRDHCSQIAAGGIVQPTPLRLEYLNRVLAAYRSRYGQAMPVDLWHIHNAILNEEKGSWGADIPPGIPATSGAIRAIDDNDNMQIFEAQIWAFRQWMADHGYGGYPLVVTEYGVLMPDDYGFGTDRVNAFLSATFEFFQEATDPVLGDPGDGGRLVQRWAWFSLDVPPWDPIDYPAGFNGNLFDPQTETVTPFGQRFAQLTNTFPPLSTVDLGVGELRAQPAPTAAAYPHVATRTIAVRALNLGTANSGPFSVNLTYDGPVSGRLTEAVGSMPAKSAQWLEFSLSGLQPGAYQVSVELDPEDLVTESAECNNRATLGFVVPTDYSTLPLVASWYDSGLVHGASAGVPAAEKQASAASTGSGFEQYLVPTASSYPAQIAVDDQNRVWFTERDGNKLGVLDPSAGTPKEYDIPTTDSQPWGLAVDSRGNVWFAETDGNKIGVLAVANGTISEYDVPTPNSKPWDVAVAGDGQVFFTERAGNKIGRLDPVTGAIVEYPLPSAGAQPTGIVVYSRYAWFTESAANRLGWLNSETGSIQEFLIPTPASTPQDVALSSAGSPWLTETTGNKIALFVVSTLQWLHEIPVATADSEPFGIARGNDGTIWFSERAANKLGRYAGSRPPREYALPMANSSPLGVAVDGNNCAWYTAPGVNRIGRFCLAVHWAYLPLVARR